MTNERGSSLVLALTALLLLTTLGLALVVLTTTDLLIASAYADGREAVYAADGALEIAAGEMATIQDWTPLLTGAMVSRFSDGAPTGPRRLQDGTILDLEEATHMLNCEKATACSPADLVRRTADRPLGANNPVWRPYAFGQVNDWLSSDRVSSKLYVVVWVGDDPAETDGNPLQDGASVLNPGMGVIALSAAAFGPGGTIRRVEATVTRPAPERGARGIRMLSWRERR
jgi:hypothetical protein